ncbi:MAG: glutamate--tRNA ligase [Candidatus Sumerlaeia bacterium]
MRIEDTDLERSQEQYVEQILDALRWLGLDWDGEVEYQSRRLTHHRQALEQLRRSGAAYPCFDTEEELKTMREAAAARGQVFRYAADGPRIPPEEANVRIARGEPHYFRFRVPAGETIIEDRVRGRVVFQNAEIDDFVLTRPNGLPTYNFACAADDAAMGITHVIRGEDHISNTPRQIMIIRALGHEPPQYAHLPLILGPDKARLSKRHGAASVQEFREQGYLPEALVNFLVLLGWALDDSTELFTREQMIQHFSLERVNPAAAVFNLEKLQWLNGIYIRERTDRARLNSLVREELVRAGFDLSLYTEQDLEAIIALAVERCRTLKDFPAVLDFFFQEPRTYDQEGVKKIFLKEGAGDNLAAARDTLAALQDWTPEALEAALRALAEQRGVGLGKIAQPLRLALTGRLASPGIFEVVLLLGRRRVLARMDRAIHYISSAGAGMQSSGHSPTG